MDPHKLELTQHLHTIRKIGEGATSIVFEAHVITTTDYANPSDKLAVKLFRHMPIGKNLERFRREVDIGMNIHAPTLVRYRKMGIYNSPLGDLPYIVMDYVGGSNLLDFVKSLSNQRADEKRSQVMSVVADIANSLANLHLHGIVHRDLQPSNISVLSGGKAVLLDFGVSKYLHDDTLSSSWEEIGTRRFWAPECLLGSSERWHPETDIFSFGSCLFHALSGTYLLSDATNYPKFFERLKDYDSSDQRKELGKLPEWLGTLGRNLIYGMLQVSVNDRPPATIIELLASGKSTKIENIDKSKGFSLSAFYWRFSELEEWSFIEKLGEKAEGDILPLNKLLEIASPETIQKACGWGLLRPYPEDWPVYVFHPSGADEPLLSSELTFEVLPLTRIAIKSFFRNPQYMTDVDIARNKLERDRKFRKPSQWELDNLSVILYGDSLFNCQPKDDPLQDYRLAVAIELLQPTYIAGTTQKGYFLPITNLESESWQRWAFGE